MTLRLPTATLLVLVVLASCSSDSDGESTTSSIAVTTEVTVATTENRSGVTSSTHLDRGDNHDDAVIDHVNDRCQSRSRCARRRYANYDNLLGVPSSAGRVRCGGDNDRRKRRRHSRSENTIGDLDRRRTVRGRRGLRLPRHRVDRAAVRSHPVDVVLVEHGRSLRPRRRSKANHRSCRTTHLGRFASRGVRARSGRRTVEVAAR